MDDGGRERGRDDYAGDLFGCDSEQMEFREMDLN